MPLDFKEDPTSSKMFCSMPEDQIHALETGAYTYNSHSYSVSPTTMQEDEFLKEFWTVTATSKDANGVDFVASMEGKDYPFMATQFHPEKITQVIKGEQINRTWDSVHINRHFGDLFVEMARANPNTWGTYEEVSAEVIQNHQIVITDAYCEDIYVF